MITVAKCSGGQRGQTTIGLGAVSVSVCYGGREARLHDYFGLFESFIFVLYSYFTVAANSPYPGELRASAPR